MPFTVHEDAQCARCRYGGRPVRDAFWATGSGSSAYRLRAYFAETLARTLLDERLALNGERLKDVIIAWVMRRVADAPRHASPTTIAAACVDQTVLRMRAAATPPPFR